MRLQLKSKQRKPACANLLLSGIGSKFKQEKKWLGQLCLIVVLQGAGRSGAEVVALPVTPEEMDYLQNLSLIRLSRNAAHSWDTDPYMFNKVLKQNLKCSFAFPCSGSFNWPSGAFSFFFFLRPARYFLLTLWAPVWQSAWECAWCPVPPSLSKMLKTVRNDKLSCFRSHLTRRASSYQLLEQPSVGRVGEGCESLYKQHFYSLGRFLTLVLVARSDLRTWIWMEAWHQGGRRQSCSNNSFHGSKQSYSLTPRAERLSSWASVCASSFPCVFTLQLQI